MIVMLTGGSGSGKSTYAEKLITMMPREKRVYIATMQIYDQESVQRVARHRKQRADMGFETIECPKNLSEVKVEDGSTVLLEDLPNLLANEMFDGGNPERIFPQIQELAKKCENLVIVTNDVFSDGIRYEESTCQYQRTLAKIATDIAKMADTVAEVVYGYPVCIKGEALCEC